MASVLIVYFQVFQILKPSSLRQALCASIKYLHFSSPFFAMHSSRAVFVSGHEQQIFFPLFPTFGGCAGAAGVLLPVPMGPDQSARRADSGEARRR